MRKVGRPMVLAVAMDGLYNGGGLGPEFDAGQIVSGNIVRSDRYPDFRAFIGRQIGPIVVDRVVAKSSGRTTGIGLFWRRFDVLLFGRFIGRRRSR